MPQTTWTQEPAVVARIEADGSLCYLADLNRTDPTWVRDSRDGLLFPSFREANHVASDLADNLKAFSLVARIAPGLGRDELGPPSQGNRSQVGRAA